MNTPDIDISAKCKSRTEYDTQPASENVRLQVGDDAAAFLDISLRGELAGKLDKGKTYQVTITEITG